MHLAKQEPWMLWYLVPAWWSPPPIFSHKHALKMHPTEYGGWRLESSLGDIDISGGSMQMQCLGRPTFAKYERFPSIFLRLSVTLPRSALSHVGECSLPLHCFIHPWSKRTSFRQINPAHTDWQFQSPVKIDQGPILQGTKYWCNTTYFRTGSLSGPTPWDSHHIT